MTFIPFILFSDIYNIYRSQLPLYITYYPEEAFGQSASVVQLFFLTNFSSLLFTYIMSKQGDGRHCNSSTSLFFERSKSEKVVTQATKKSREETDNPVTFVNTSDKTATTSKANSISYYTQQNEKLAFKRSYLNDKKQDMSLIMNS